MPINTKASTAAVDVSGPIHLSPLVTPDASDVAYPLARATSHKP